MTVPDLIASAWTTAGDVVPHLSDERSPERLEDRIAAAAAAGFAGMGFVHADIEVIRRGPGLAEAKAMLAARGIRHIELEMLMDWPSLGRSARAVEIRDLLLEAATALGARQIKIGCDTGAGDYPWDVLVRDFRDLCQRAAASGTRIALEFLPFASIRTPAEALRLIEAADHPAGGMLIDIWHIERGNVPLDTLRALPPDRIFAVELDDAAAEARGTLLEDTLFNRRFCGEGDFRLPAFIAALRDIGYAGPWGVEIISDDFRKLPMPVAVRRAYETAAAQFATS